MSIDEPWQAPSTLVQAGETGFQFLAASSPDDISIIARLRETQADVKGRAFLIDVSHLITGLGARWQSKEAFVWDYFQTSFSQKFEEPNWGTKLNGNMWLAVTVTVGPRTGALKCAEVWNETGQFFIGNVADVRLPIFEVIVEDSTRLKLRLIDLKTYFDRGEDFGANSEVRPQSSSRPEDEIGRENLSVGTVAPIKRPLISGQTLRIGGRTLTVACAVEPIFELKKLSMIGHRLEPTVIDLVANLQLDGRALKAMDWADREQVDLANIERGVNVLRGKSREQRKMLMIVPVAFSTLASSRGRAKVTSDLTKASAELGLKILFEMRAMTGVPPHRVMEIISMVKPYCMTVVGHVGTDLRSIPSLRHNGLSGVCVDYDGATRSEEDLQSYLSALSATAKVTTGACMIRGFDNFRQIAVARLAGVSHASVKASALMATGPKP